MKTQTPPIKSKSAPDNAKPTLRTYTITCNRPLNYGAVLQSYALNKALRNLDFDARVLDYSPRYYRKSNKPLPVRLLRAVLRFPDRLVGARVFDTFLRTYIPMSRRTYTSLREITDDLPQADAYIAGSDQIWNCANLPNGKDDAFFLTFAPKTALKISYAASLAMPCIPSEQRSRYARLISNFDAVSIREQSGVALLEELGINGVHQTLDPVFLLKASDWDAIAEDSPVNPPEKYVLVYGYARQSNVYSYARALAKRLNAKVCSINTAIEDHFLDTDTYFWNASPNTFVKLVKNAEAVVTNSFHGTAFSIIFNKPFHFFPVTLTTNSRMLDLLDALHLSDRCVTEQKPLDQLIDYTNTNATLEELRKDSLDFLVSSLRSAS